MLGLEDLARDVLKQGHSRRSDGVGDHRVLGSVHGPKVAPESGQYDFEPGNKTWAYLTYEGKFQL